MPRPAALRTHPSRGLRVLTSPRSLREIRVRACRSLCVRSSVACACGHHPTHDTPPPPRSIHRRAERSPHSPSQTWQQQLDRGTAWELICNRARARSNEQLNEFDHEKLDVSVAAIDVVALNIAEGAGSSRPTTRRASLESPSARQPNAPPSCTSATVSHWSIPLAIKPVVSCCCVSWRCVSRWSGESRDRARARNEGMLQVPAGTTRRTTHRRTLAHSLSNRRTSLFPIGSPQQVVYAPLGSPKETRWPLRRRTSGRARWR
jgi:hypothetical protein